MDIEVIRAELHRLVESADDDLLQEFYVAVKDDIEANGRHTATDPANSD